MYNRFHDPERDRRRHRAAARAARRDGSGGGAGIRLGRPRPRPRLPRDPPRRALHHLRGRAPGGARPPARSQPRALRRGGPKRACTRRVQRRRPSDSASSSPRRPGLVRAQPDLGFEFQLTPPASGSPMIELIGPEHGDERRAAEWLREGLLQLWPDIAESKADRVRIHAAAKLFGYRVQDLDVLLLAHFGERRSFQPTTAFRPREGCAGAPALGERVEPRARDRGQGTRCARHPVRGHDRPGPLWPRRRGGLGERERAEPRAAPCAAPVPERSRARRDLRHQSDPVPEPQGERSAGAAAQHHRWRRHLHQNPERARRDREPMDSGRARVHQRRQARECRGAVPKTALSLDRADHDRPQAHGSHRAQGGAQQGMAGGAWRAADRVPRSRRRRQDGDPAAACLPRLRRAEGALAAAHL